jgi:hypothetical protein
MTHGLPYLPAQADGDMTEMMMTPILIVKLP